VGLAALQVVNCESSKMEVAAPEQIKIKFFGDPSLDVRGRTVNSFRSNRIVGLLGLLILHSGAQARDWIAAQLWPDAEVCRSKHNLRQILLYLKEILGEDFDRLLDVTRNSVGLRAEFVESDLMLLMDTQRHQEYGGKSALCERAVKECGGTFLPGLHEPWVVQTRDRLDHVYIQALLFRSDEELAKKPQVALEYAARAVALEPMMDGPRARKIRALVRTGEKAAALREFEAFANLLHDELGIRPGDTVRAALEEKPSSKSAYHGAPDREIASSDIVYAIESLSTGDRPQRALELAVSLTPHWIDIGTPALGIELTNLALERGSKRASQELKVVARICIAELTFARGDLIYAEDMIHSLEDELADSPNKIRARAMLLRVRIALTEKKTAVAAQIAAQALELLEEAQDLSIELDLMIACALTGYLESHIETATHWADRAIQLAESLQENTMLGVAWVRKAQALESAGRKAEAEVCVRRSLAVSNNLETNRGRSQRMSVARLMEELGLLEEAEAGYRAVLAATTAKNTAFDATLVLTYLGDLLESTGRAEEAVGHHSKALAIRRQYGQTLGIATSLRGLGRAYLGTRDLEGARDALLESAQLYQNLEAVPGYASVLAALALVEFESGEEALALRLAKRARKILLGFSDSDIRSIGPRGFLLAGECERVINRCQEAVSA
jgi:DNA-binding SARP family transcriptional activator/tetratricopeptide (TPR) repeat protein